MNTARNAWMTGLLAAAGGVSLTQTSLAADVYADVPPPPPRVEHAPPPRDGYIWGSGHWAWSGRSYYWVDGSWVAQRRHMVWIPDQWVEAGEKWHFVPAHWQQSP